MASRPSYTAKILVTVLATTFSAVQLSVPIFLNARPECIPGNGFNGSLYTLSAALPTALPPAFPRFNLPPFPSSPTFAVPASVLLFPANFTSGLLPDFSPSPTSLLPAARKLPAYHPMCLLIEIHDSVCPANWTSPSTGVDLAQLAYPIPPIPLTPPSASPRLPVLDFISAIIFWLLVGHATIPLALGPWNLNTTIAFLVEEAFSDLVGWWCLATAIVRYFCRSSQGDGMHIVAMDEANILMPSTDSNGEEDIIVDDCSVNATKIIVKTQPNVDLIPSTQDDTTADDSVSATESLEEVPTDAGAAGSEMLANDENNTSLPEEATASQLLEEPEPETTEIIVRRSAGENDVPVVAAISPEAPLAHLAAVDEVPTTEDFDQEADISVGEETLVADDGEIEADISVEIISGTIKTLIPAVIEDDSEIEGVFNEQGWEEVVRKPRRSSKKLAPSTPFVSASSVTLNHNLSMATIATPELQSEAPSSTESATTPMVASDSAEENKRVDGCDIMLQRLKGQIHAVQAHRSARFEDLDNDLHAQASTSSATPSPAAPLRPFSASSTMPAPAPAPANPTVLSLDPELVSMAAALETYKSGSKSRTSVPDFMALINDTIRASSLPRALSVERDFPGLQAPPVVSAPDPAAKEKPEPSPSSTTATTRISASRHPLGSLRSGDVPGSSTQVVDADPFPPLPVVKKAAVGSGSGVVRPPVAVRKSKLVNAKW